MHYAQPHIFKASFDAIIEAFTRRGHRSRVSTVTSPNWEGAQLILRQAATNQLPATSPTRASGRLRLFGERQIALNLTAYHRREGAT